MKTLNQILNLMFNLKKSLSICLKKSGFEKSLGLKKFSIKKKVSVSVSKNLDSKKVSVSVTKIFGLKKSLGISLDIIWSRKKVSVSVSKIFGLKKVSILVSNEISGLVTQ